AISLPLGGSALAGDVSLGGSRPLSRWLTGKAIQSSALFPLFFDLSFGIINQPINGVAAVLDVGNKIGQAGVDFGSGLNVMVQQFFRRLPIPFLNDDSKLIGKSLRSHRA
ncbi:unnamed protein product, partial [Brassica oleracea var. botrytis]